MLATGIVPGGGAWAQAQRASDAVATVQPGDAIVGVADGAGAARVSTEGASFDEVVAAIGSVRERSDTIRLSVKRMVRRGVAQVRASGLAQFYRRVQCCRSRQMPYCVHTGCRVASVAITPGAVLCSHPLQFSHPLLCSHPLQCSHPLHAVR